MVSSAATKIYPRFGANVWWALRDEFKRSFPKTVDAAYLAARLNQSFKSARNLMPSLRSLGLVDDSGRLTEIANLWRNDQTYRQACDEMLHRAFPEAVAAFPPPVIDRKALERWFASTTRTGTNSARQMASFYDLIATSTPQDAQLLKDSGLERARGAARAAARATEVRKMQVASQDHPPEDVVSVKGAISPNVPQINLHVHLPPDVTVPQLKALLETIFVCVGERSTNAELGYVEAEQ